ncbi:centromere protein F isoform X2 [Patella vulgata]|uniref:centromere protein F isoform X2 n=1 Tax=Patella vulgata TaxID=6465 RepID=UPI0024A8C434|nr:centromere protein F isoform X2 [Patella vulgata]
MASSPRRLERQNSEGSAESLKTLNADLRNHLARLRTQLEYQKGDIKQAHWQRVLNVRTVREIEQQKCSRALEQLKFKLEVEKQRELENLKVSLLSRHEGELLKITRQRDAEAGKLKQELDLKERMLRKLLGENRRGSLNLNIFAKRNKLMNELADLRTSKKELEESLEYANEAERHHNLHVKKTAESCEYEVQKVQREAHMEIKQLIEQLKNKDKIISHLEKELGQTAGYALSLQLDRNHQNKMSAATLTAGTDRQLSFSSPLKHNQTLKTFSLDNSYNENQTEAGLELETESNQSDDSILDKQAVKKLKDLEERHKSLKERNRKFLEKNVELTSENRNLKDQISSLTEESGKLKEQSEHSKRKATVYARQLSQEKLKLVNFELQLSELHKLRQQLTEQTKTITSLRQSCSEKDRRMELIQHHKKRRKLRRSQEKCRGVKETFYGYDEDQRSMDSENSLSLSSTSHGTLSDDDLWDELSREEREKSYQKLMKEHLQLEKSHALLMKQTDNYQDPQRSNQLRCDLEHNLILSQGRIEELEQVLRSSGKDDICDLLKERDRLVNMNEMLENQLQESEKNRVELSEELAEKRDQMEDMEFQILEFQESVDEAPKCSQGETTQDDNNESLIKEKLSISLKSELEGKMEIEELRQEIAGLLEGRGKEVDVILQKLDTLKNAEQQIEALEVTARELQAKVISLQQDKTNLEELLADAQQKASQHKEPIMNPDAPDLSQMEMLDLKDQISAHEISELELMEKNIELQEKLAEFESNSENQIMQIVDLENKVKSHKQKLDTFQNKTSMSQNQPEFDQNFRTVTKEIEKLVEKAANPVPTKSKTKNFGNQTDVILQANNSSDEVKSLEKKLQKMHEENLKLKQKLERKLLDYDSDKSSDDERESRISELENVCEELKERSYGAELAERQIKEQLKLAEQTINDLESSEGMLREKSEKLKYRDNEAKKQVKELHHIVEEMKDIIQEKDIVELSLREKVQFLEKVESASNQQIAELQASEFSLKEQVSTLEKHQTDPELITELKHQIQELAVENERLGSRVAELEEEEEILRDNWRKVAAEDAKRAFNQQEKLQLLELMNRELKSKLHESQEAAAISILNNSSLAMELSESQGQNEFSNPSSEVSDLQLKIRHLEDELLEVTEIKNNKIELLQERIEKFRENEIKLSETVMEAEVAEAELKSRLAFYESSQVTVEKILDYEDKLHELRSSQEDLLEQLHSLENHEEDLTEKLERTEKEHKAQISRLKAEISKYKEREKSSTKKLSSLEKHEEELMEKVTKFGIAEKRLQDKVEAREAVISELRLKIEEKSDKIRELDSTKTEMFNQITKLLDNEKILNDKITELKKSVTNYKSVADSKSGSVESLKHGYENQIEKMETQAQTQSEKILQLEQSFSVDSESRDEKIKLLEKENSELVKKLESLKKKSSAKIKQLEKCVFDAEERENQCRDNVTSANNKLSLSRSDILESESRLEEMITSEQKLKENIKYLEETVVVGLENEVCDLKNKIFDLNNKINELTSNNSDMDDLLILQEKLDKEVKINQTLSESKNQLESELENVTHYSETIKTKLENLELKNKELVKLRTETEAKMGDSHQEISRLREKIEVLLDGESRLMDRVSELEESERKLTDEMEGLKSSTTLEISEIPKEQSTTLESSFFARRESFASNKRGSIGAYSDTSDNELSGSMKISSLYQRVQALEAEKEELTARLSEASATESSLKQLKDKIRLLEESEDRLMERVMELEENEDRLKKEINSLKDDANLELVTFNETELKRSIDKLKHEKESLESEIQLVEDQLQEEKQRSSKLQDRVTYLDTLETNNKSSIARLEISNDDLKTRLTNTEDKLKVEKNKSVSYDTKNKNLTKELEAANEKMKQDREREVESLKTMETTLKKTIKELTEEKADLENQFIETQQELKEERGKLETKLREQKLNFDNLQKSKVQLDEELVDMKQKAKQLQNELTNSQNKIQFMQSEYESKATDLEKKETELREKVKEKTRTEFDLKKKVQNLEKLIKQNQADSEEMDQKCTKLEKSFNETSTHNNILKEKVQALEEELSKYTSLSDEYRTMKVVQSETSTELEVLREKLTDFTSTKKEHDLLLEENANFRTKIQELENTLADYQNLQEDHEHLITAHRESGNRLQQLEKCSIELNDLKREHEKLSFIHCDSEQKLNSVKEMLGDFEILKQKHAEILEVNQNLESRLVTMVNPEDHENVVKGLNETLDKMKNLEQEVIDVTERTRSEEQTKSAVKIKALERTIEEFSTLQDEYKSLLKIHHTANQTISDLEDELSEYEKRKQSTTISTQTDSNADVSNESAVFSENDSPTHRSILHKTEDRTSFIETPFQSKHSISLTSANPMKKSFVLSKPKTIGLPVKKHSTGSLDMSHSNRELENQIRQLEGENSRLKEAMEQKIEVIQTFQNEMEHATKVLNEISGEQSTSYEKCVNHEIPVLSEKIENLRRLVTEARAQETNIRSRICNGDHGEFNTKIAQLQREENLLHEKISKLENSNKELNDRLKKLPTSANRSSTSPDGDRRKSSYLKEKIKFFESGQKEEADDMLDKPEDVLRQQIADMEVLRQQVVDLEHDRDKLHDNARRDKQIIHNQHIEISELQLSEKMLKEQVNALTRSERELYEKGTALEDQIAKQEDQIHELQILERRLRELVRKLKLDEEQWMAKSENMVANMEDLSHSETVLKTKIGDLEIDNSKMADKLEYYELRLKELESSEVTLIQKVKHYENMESRLQAKFKDLENCRTAANSQASELDIVSTDLESRLEHALEENNILARHVTELRTQTQDIDRQLLNTKDNEVGLKQHVASLEKSETVLQKRVKEFELREIDNRAENREIQQTVAILKDRISALQRNENRLKFKIQELESGDVQSSTHSENKKLPENIEDCHQRIIELQDVVAKLQRSVDVNDNHDNKEIQERELWEEAERQMEELERLNHHLNSLVQDEKNGKEISGQEVDIAKLNRRLESYQDFLLRLKQNLLIRRGSSLEHPESGVCQGSNQIQRGDLQSLENKRVMQSVRGLTTQTEETTVKGSQQGLLKTSRNFERQSDDKYLSRSDVIAHEEQIKRDTSGVYSSPPNRSASKEVKKRLNHFESNNMESSKDEGRWNNSKSAKPASDDVFDVSNGWTSVAKATSLSQPHQGKGYEELVIGLTLPSESEGQSANDTDSAMSSPDVPQAQKSSSKRRSKELAPPLPKSLPPTLSGKTVFAQDSYYLPSFEKGSVGSTDGELDNNSLVSPPRGKDSITPSPEAAAVHPSDNVYVSTLGLEYLTEGQAPIRNFPSLDSVADSGRGTVASNVGQLHNLVDKIGFIEKQLQETNEETETEEESMFSWKTKASERGQQLEVASSANRQIQNEINLLEKEVEEKNRYISTLDQWLHSFEEIFKNKDIKSDRDIIQQLQADLVKVKGELTNSGQRKEDISKDPAALQTQLTSKNRELSAKREEVETLLRVIRSWQEECRTIENMRSNALDSLRALEVEALELQDVHSDLTEMKNEYDSLRGQMNKVKELTEETVRLNDRVKGLENENASFQSVKEEYDSLRARFDEIESSKEKALTDVAPLKAKVARLSQNCHEKNSLIRRLVDELQTKGGKSVLLDELRRLEVAMTDESDIEGLITASPLASTSHMAPRSQVYRNQGRTSPAYSSSSSSISDARDLLSDTELMSAPEHRLPQRPRSAEHASRQNRHTRRHLSSKTDYLTPNKEMRNTHASPDEPKLYMALADYNPQLFSRSDKPWLEIPLQEGDRVKVIGQLSHSGYYEAEVNNRVGLVPASYLQPLHHSPEWYHSAIQGRRIQNLQSTPRNQEGSPEKIVNMFHQLNQVQPSPINATGTSTSHFQPVSGNNQTTQTKGQGQTTTTTQTFYNIPPRKPPTSRQAGAPDPPSNFKVQKIIGGNSLMLSWLPPKLNELNQSNGSPVTGYRIFCNGQIRHQSHSPLLAKAVIENILVARQHKFSIQTMAANGHVSTSVSITYDGVVTPSSGSDSDHESDADLSSIFSKVSQGQGPRRQFIGVYDYNPQHHSRQDLTGQELSFQTGDEITVFGNQRPDGFYHAEINGKKGLVPARFIEELPSSPSKNTKSNKSYSAPVQPLYRSTGSIYSRGNHSLPPHSQPH